MAKKQKDDSAASQRLKDAEKLVQQRQAQKAKGKKTSPGKFIKDFRADIKKIIWPDFKTVLKNTGIVLAVVAVVGLAVFLIDTGMVSILRLLHSFAESINPTPEVTTTDPEAAAAVLLPIFRF